MIALTRRAALAAALLAVPLAARAADLPPSINFGIISTEGSQNLRSRWAPFIEDMSKETGMKINAFYATDYAGVIEAMWFNKVQVAWFGNASAIQAVDRSNGEVFAQKVYADGSPGYNSLLIVNKDGPIKSLDQLLHAPSGTYDFGNGDPNSTSGFLIPSYYLWAKNGIDVRRFFKNVVTSNHETNLMAVATRTVDVATNNTEDLAKFRKAQPERAAMIKEVWRSPIIPADPIVWRKDLPEPAKQRIRDFLLTYGRERPDADVAHERAVLAGLGGWGGFIASSNAQLLPIRQVALFKQKIQVQEDTKLSPEQRDKRLGEIDRQLNELDRELTSTQASAR